VVKFLLVYHCTYVCVIPFLTYSTSTYCVALKSRFGVTQDHWKWNHSIVRVRVAVSVPRQLQCMALPGEILVQNRDFYHTSSVLDSPQRRTRWNFAVMFGLEKLEWWDCKKVKSLRICSAVSIQYTNVTDGLTDCDRQTPRDGIDRAMHNVARQKRRSSVAERPRDACHLIVYEQSFVFIACWRAILI